MHRSRDKQHDTVAQGCWSLPEPEAMQWAPAVWTRQLLQVCGEVLALQSSVILLLTQE